MKTSAVCAHLNLWAPDTSCVLVQGSWIGHRIWDLTDFSHFHSHAYTQVYWESLIPTKLLDGLFHVLLLSWPNQQKCICKLSIPNQLQNSYLKNSCFMRGKYSFSGLSSAFSDFHINSVATQHWATDQIQLRVLALELLTDQASALQSFTAPPLTDFP